jgi:hypothetical protein
MEVFECKGCDGVWQILIQLAGFEKCWRAEEAWRMPAFVGAAGWLAAGSF